MMRWALAPDCAVAKAVHAIYELRPERTELFVQCCIVKKMGYIKIPLQLIRHL